MTTRTWDSFRNSTSEDKYNLYFYLASAHSISGSILLTLSRFNVFQNERYFFDNFVIALEEYLLNCETRNWDGMVGDHDDDVGVLHGLPWFGSFDSHNLKYGCMESITIREKHDGLHIYIDTENIVVYVWKFGFIITRNKVPVKYQELFEHIKLDVS